MVFFGHFSILQTSKASSLHAEIWDPTTPGPAASDATVLLPDSMPIGRWAERDDGKSLG